MPIEDEFNPADNNPFIGKEPAARVQPTSLDTVDTGETGASRKRLADHWKELSTGEKVKLAGTGATAASLAALAIIGGPEIVDRVNGPEFSPETTTITVEQGDDLYSIAESIPGHEFASTDAIVNHLKADPANVDIADTSVIHPGMQITIPVKIEK